MTNYTLTGLALAAVAFVGVGATTHQPSGKPEAVEVVAVADKIAADIVAPDITPVAPDVTPAEPIPAPAFWVDYSTAYAKSHETGEPMVVVFGMSGCEPCKAVKADIESEAEAGVIYCYVDVVAEPEVAQNFGYTPPNLTVPKVEVLAYQEGVLVRSWRHDGQPLKSVVCGAVRLAAKTGKRALSVLKKAVTAPVKAAQWVREHQPVRSAVCGAACAIQERAPVRTFFRNGGFFRR